MAEPLRVACDGSSLRNPGPAGWAWYISPDCWAAGGRLRATNNAMELTALLSFLEATRRLIDDVPTIIYLDSQYAINCCTIWWKGWMHNGWRTRNGTDVLNADLIQAIIPLLDERDDTHLEWVRGHAGHPLNEAADRRAQNAAIAVSSKHQVRTGPGWIPTAVPRELGE
jgi:ribonuclease HI